MAFSPQFVTCCRCYLLYFNLNNNLLVIAEMTAYSSLATSGARAARILNGNSTSRNKKRKRSETREVLLHVRTHVASRANQWRDRMRSRSRSSRHGARNLPFWSDASYGTGTYGKILVSNSSLHTAGSRFSNDVWLLFVPPRDFKPLQRQFEDFAKPIQEKPHFCHIHPLGHLHGIKYKLLSPPLKHLCRVCIFASIF